jgi:hypothetical protein
MVGGGRDWWDSAGTEPENSIATAEEERRGQGSRTDEASDDEGHPMAQFTQSPGGGP